MRQCTERRALLFRIEPNGLSIMAGVVQACISCTERLIRREHSSKSDGLQGVGVIQLQKAWQRRVPSQGRRPSAAMWQLLPSLGQIS